MQRCQSSLCQAVGWRRGAFLHQPQGAVGSGEGSFSAPEVSEGSCGQGLLHRHHSGGLSQISGWYIVSHFHRVSPVDPSLGDVRLGAWRWNLLRQIHVREFHQQLSLLRFPVWRFLAFCDDFLLLFWACGVPPSSFVL